MADLYRLLLRSGIGHASLLVMLFLAVVSSFVAALPPHFLGAIVNVVGSAGSGADIVYSPLTPLNSLMAAASRIWGSPIAVFSILFFIGSCLAVIIRNLFVIFVSICADRFIMYIRKACLQAVIGAEKRAIARFASGDVVHRVMADTKQLDYLVGVPTYVLASDVFDLLWVSFFIALLDWRLLLILAAVFPILYLLGKKTGKVRRAISKKIQETEAEGTGYVQRVLSGLDTIKVFGAEKKENKGFARLMGGVFSLEVDSSMKLGTFFCLEGALRALGTICAVGYAAWLASDNPVYAGAIPVLILYSQRFYSPIGNWARFYQVIQQSIISFHRLQDLLRLPGEQLTQEKSVLPDPPYPFEVKGGILLESGREVRMDIEFPGPGLVIVRGKSGVGKTQFTKSLLTLGPAFEGELRLGGHVWNRENLLSARPFFAYASQEGFFLSGTVAENIAYPHENGEIDRERCRELLDALDMAHFSLDGPVEENARNLSLGEGRRLILGRALYSRRPLLVLDEIDANVDPDTRKKIYTLVAEEQRKRPIIMITHANAAELTGLEHRCIVCA